MRTWTRSVIGMFVVAMLSVAGGAFGGDARSLSQYPGSSDLGARVLAPTESVLHSFGPAALTNDGRNPEQSLVRDPLGNLYGTTTAGGANGTGTVYMLSPPKPGATAWSTTVLYSFGALSGTEAIYPNSRLLRDAAGNLYGTSAGGRNSTGAVFKLAPPASGRSGWSATIIYSFGDIHSNDAKEPTRGGLIEDARGNLYGTTSLGGAHDFGTVYMLTAPAPGQTAWSESVLHSFGASGSGDGQTPECALVLDDEGNIYGTTLNGGLNSKGTVFELAAPTSGQTAWAEAILYSFGAGFALDGENPFAGVLIDGHGVLYGTTINGGAYAKGSVFALVPPLAGQRAWTESVIYSFGADPKFDGRFPEAGLIQDRQGKLFGTTSQGGENLTGTVFELTPPHAAQSAWTETVLRAFGANASTAAQTPFFGSLIQDGQGNLYGTTVNGGAHDAGTVFMIAL